MKKVIEVNGEPVGYVQYGVFVSQSSTLYIHQFMIYPQYRRKGHFKTMLAETRRIARDLGCPTMTLSVGSWEETEEYLYSLYKGHGFRELPGKKTTWLQADT